MRNYLMLIVLMMLFASCESRSGKKVYKPELSTDTLTFKAKSLIDGTIAPVKFLRENWIYRANDTVWVDSRNGFIATNFVEATPENTVRWGNYVKYRITLQK